MFLMNLMEMIGTFAFAVSGALVGLRHKLDLFGVFVLIGYYSIRRQADPRYYKKRACRLFQTQNILL